MIQPECEYIGGGMPPAADSADEVVPISNSTCQDLHLCTVTVRICTYWFYVFEFTGFPVSFSYLDEDSSIYVRRFFECFMGRSNLGPRLLEFMVRVEERCGSVWHWVHGVSSIGTDGGRTYCGAGCYHWFS